MKVEPSAYLPVVCEHLKASGLAVKVVEVACKFQRGVNQMLVVTSRND